MPEKRILHAENYWHLSCLGYVFSNIESWDIKFIKVVTWNKIPMSHKVTFKRIPHISGASLSGSAGECWRFHTDVSDEVPSLRRSLLSLSSLEQTVINSCQGLQSLLWASEHFPKLSMTESGDKITQSYTRMRRADLRLHPLIFQTSGIIWWLGLFGYYGASLGSGLIFSSSGSFDYGELIFSSMGEIAGVTVAICLAWRVSEIIIQPWFYLVGTLACLAVLIAHALKGPALLLGALAFILRAGSMGAISVTWVLTPTAFPTHVRCTAHSILYTAGSLGPVCATLWPGTTPLAVIMGSYAGANLVCAIVGQWQVKGLAAHLGDNVSFGLNGDFQSMGVPLNHPF